MQILSLIRNVLTLMLRYYVFVMKFSTSYCGFEITYLVQINHYCWISGVQRQSLRPLPRTRTLVRLKTWLPLMYPQSMKYMPFEKLLLEKKNRN